MKRKTIESKDTKESLSKLYSLTEILYMLNLFGIFAEEVNISDSILYFLPTPRRADGSSYAACAAYRLNEKGRVGAGEALHGGMNFTLASKYIPTRNGLNVHCLEARDNRDRGNNSNSDYFRVKQLSVKFLNEVIETVKSGERVIHKNLTKKELVSILNHMKSKEKLLSLDFVEIRARLLDTPSR